MNVQHDGPLRQETVEIAAVVFAGDKVPAQVVAEEHAGGSQVVLGRIPPACPIVIQGRDLVDP